MRKLFMILSLTLLLSCSPGDRTSLLYKNVDEITHVKQRPGICKYGLEDSDSYFILPCGYLLEGTTLMDRLTCCDNKQLEVEKSRDSIKILRKHKVDSLLQLMENDK